MIVVNVDFKGIIIPLLLVCNLDKDVSLNVQKYN